MGTASTTKFIKNNSGNWKEEAAVIDSAGAADAHKLVALGATGLIHDSMMNANAASSANAVVKQTAAGIIAPAVLNAVSTSAGVGSADKIAQLGADGRLNSNMMPVGITPEVKTFTASEALSAGNYVNIHNVTGSWRIRKADATTVGKHAHGFVLAAVSNGASGDVYFEGNNTGVSGMTPGDVFLSTTAGGGAATAPSASGNIVQKLGVALSATEVLFEPQPFTELV